MSIFKGFLKDFSVKRFVCGGRGDFMDFLMVFWKSARDF